MIAVLFKREMEAMDLPEWQALLLEIEAWLAAEGIPVDIALAPSMDWNWRRIYRFADSDSAFAFKMRWL